MKKFIYTLLFTTVISILFGTFIFSIYKKNINNILEVSEDKDVYMLLYGSYNSKDKVDKLNLNDYLLENNNNFYEVYIGISLSIENSNKIREIYKKLGNNIYIRQKSLNNYKFLEYLSIAENDFDKKSDNEILEIEKDIIKKYKELNE